MACSAVLSAPLPDVVDKLKKDGIAVQPEAVVHGILGDAGHGTAHVALHAFQLLKGQSYEIEVQTADVPVNLHIKDGKKVLVAKLAGDTPASTSIRRVFRAPTDDTYHFELQIITAQAKTGKYALTVRAQPLGVRKDPPNVHHVDKGGLAIESSLNNMDPLDRVRRKYCKVFEVRLEANKTYTIDMISRQFDTYLRLEDANMKQLAQDDDGGEGLNARIHFRAQADGVYRVITTSFGLATGTFTLKVREN